MGERQHRRIVLPNYLNLSGSVKDVIADLKEMLDHEQWSDEIREGLSILVTTDRDGYPETQYYYDVWETDEEMAEREVTEVAENWSELMRVTGLLEGAPPPHPSMIDPLRWRLAQLKLS